MNELENQHIKSLAKLIKQLTKVQETAQQAAIAPVVCQTPAALRAVNNSNNTAASNEKLGPANLVHCPANLYTLWNKYKVSVAGNKAAKQFIPTERGRVKSKYYCRRKKF